MLFGERSLRYALQEYTTHFHHERPHHGKGNVVLMPSPRAKTKTVCHGGIKWRERLGGLLKFYARTAA
jgi:hypothetical protein